MLLNKGNSLMGSEIKIQAIYVMQNLKNYQEFID